MTFMFYLCNSCVESHGPIAGTFMTPDDVFRASIKDAMLNDGLTIEQLISVVQEDASPLATLISSRL